MFSGHYPPEENTIYCTNLGVVHELDRKKCEAKVEITGNTQILQDPNDLMLNFPHKFIITKWSL